MHLLIAAAVVAGSLFSASGSFAQKSPEPWRSAIFRCINEQNQRGSCPLRAYEQELLDPRDQSSLSGDKSLNVRLTRQSFSAKEVGGSSAKDFGCRTAKTGIPVRCAIAHEGNGGLLSGVVPDSGRFVLLGAPYRRKIDEPLKLIGLRYRSQGFDYDVVDDYWRDWVKFEDLVDADRITVSELLGNLTSKPQYCQGDRDCKRYDLLLTPDGVAAIGVCEHTKIGTGIGPPDPNTCKPEFAFSDDAVWVLAAAKAVPGTVGGCMRCAVCCLMQMADFADFLSMDEEDAFRKKYDSFIAEVAKRLRSGFQSRPWAFSSVDFDAGTGDFRAISTRRRSSIIDGFEDLYLFFQPIVRPKKEEAGKGEVERSFLRMEQKGIMAPALSPKGSASLYVSVHLEIYVSKYNTVDDQYWIKPSREQEQRFRDRLTATLTGAFEGSCRALGFLWETHETGARRCRDPAG
jgi:hypothetical protein